MRDTKSFKLMKRVVSRGQERRNQHKPVGTPLLFLSENDLRSAQRMSDHGRRLSEMASYLLKHFHKLRHVADIARA